MKRCALCLLSLLGLLLMFASNRSMAQTSQGPVSAQEYIQSVSPLSGGGSVVSRSTPGSSVQTITTLSQLPIRSTAPTVGFEPRAYQGQWGSAYPSDRYAYPSRSSAALAPRPTNTLGMEPVSSRSYQQTGFYQPNGSVQVAQNCATCNGGTTTNYPIPNVPFQSGTAINPPASLGTPNLSAPQPTYVPDGNPPGMYYNPNPGLNTGTLNSPRVNYTPVLPLRNLPPGTYIGQGVFGQPKAYIDGEPIRNLLRYITY